MSIDDLEQLIRKYLSTGLAVVIVIVAPGTKDAVGDVLSDVPSVVTVEPDERRRDRDRTGVNADDPAEDREKEHDPGGAGTGPGPREDIGGSRAGGGSGKKYGETGNGGKPDDRSGRAGHDGDGRTAAEVHGWGEPSRVDEFDSASSLRDWNIYDGPGHAGKGRRTPDAVSVEDGILTITGNAAGETAGMAWLPGQKYGRWEGRVKAPASDPSYNALLLLWPDAEDFPVGGEIDFMEMLDHTRRTTDIFIHYGPDNKQVNGKVQVDATEWHNWAVEWTPESITAYVDGEEWYRTTDTSIFPPGPMHLCIQLDWFPEGTAPKESYMHVDWVRQYPVDATGPNGMKSGSGRYGHDEG